MSTPQVTQVKVIPTRLPTHMRPRLARLARRGSEVCRKHGAALLAEISIALEVALVDLAGAELRERNASDRMRAAELEVGKLRTRIKELEQNAKRELGEAKARIIELERCLLDERPRDFLDEGEPTMVRDDELAVPVAEFGSSEPTAVREDRRLIEQCREERGGR